MSAKTPVQHGQRCHRNKGNNASAMKVLLKEEGGKVDNNAEDIDGEDEVTSLD